MIEEVIEIIISNRKYRITKEGSPSDFYNFGAWFTKLSGYCPGPVYRLWRKTLFFGWVRVSATNTLLTIEMWKERYFKNG